jgi:hypothetical protein
MLEWIGLSQTAAVWIAIVSTGMLIAALIAVPLLIVRIPADYFAHPRRTGAVWHRKRPWFRWVWLVAKNALGGALFVTGVLMLVLPGQGLLTLLFAVALLDFPGKFRLQRWVATRRGVIDSINWIRKKAGRDPLVFGPATTSESRRP